MLTCGILWLSVSPGLRFLMADHLNYSPTLNLEWVRVPTCRIGGQSVCRHLTEGDKLNRQLTLSPHSRGMISVAQGSDELVEDNLVGRLVGTGVAGLTPLPRNEITDQMVAELTAQEVFSWTNIRHGLGSVAVLGAFVASAAPHLLDMGHARDEIKDIMSTDVTSEVHALSQALGGRAVIWALMRDPYCPGSRVVSALDERFSGNVWAVDTSHAGPLIDTCLVEAYYGDLIGEEEVSRPSIMRAA